MNRERLNEIEKAQASIKLEMKGNTQRQDFEKNIALSGEWSDLERERWEIIKVYNNTEEGIREEILRAVGVAEREGQGVAYTRTHYLSPNSIQIYMADSKSPSGVRRAGSLPLTDLSLRILEEEGLGYAGRRSDPYGYRG